MYSLHTFGCGRETTGREGRGWRSGYHDHEHAELTVVFSDSFTVSPKTQFWTACIPRAWIKVTLSRWLLCYSATSSMYLYFAFISRGGKPPTCYLPRGQFRLKVTHIYYSWCLLFWSWKGYFRKLDYSYVNRDSIVSDEAAHPCCRALQKTLIIK